MMTGKGFHLMKLANLFSRIASLIFKVILLLNAVLKLEFAVENVTILHKM